MDWYYAYFVDGKESQATFEDNESYMQAIVTKKLNIAVVGISLCFCLLAIFFAKNRSSKMTRGIITLYETLRSILD